MEYKQVIGAITLMLAFSVSPVSAANLNDVIYLENGSIIRGIIIEHNLKDGEYKIQSVDGSVFVYKVEDIEKVTKEPKFGANQSSAALVLDDEPPARRQAIGVSSWGLSFTRENTDDESRFVGGAITYQYALNNHLAMRTNLYGADHEIIVGLSLVGGSAQLILTSNARNNGFKFYIGGGYFAETWEYGLVSEDYSGGEGVFGFGYNWSRVGLDLAGGVRPTAAYDVDDNIMVVTGALRLTFRH